MGTFNRKNIMQDSHEVVPVQPSKEVTMATEGIAGDLAKIVGMVVIGIWVVGAISMFINALFFSRNQSKRIQAQIESFRKLSISGKGNKLERSKLVAQLTSQNGRVNRLMAECINEGGLWNAVTSLAKRGLIVWREKITVLEATAAIDKLYVARDERVFAARAMKLAEEINASAAGVRSDLAALAEELHKAGIKVNNRVYFREKYNDLNGVRQSANDLAQLYESFREYADEEFGVDRLSTRGEFAIGAFVDSIAADIANADKDAVNAEKTLKEVEKIRMDKEVVKKFLSSTDEIRQADEILTANMKLLALATRVRSFCAVASMRVEEAMLGAINGTLKAEYKQGTPRTALESLQPTREIFVGETMVEEICKENSKVFGTLLFIGTCMIRNAGIQAELGGDQANKFKDSDVARLLAARIQNRKKF